MRHHPRTAVTVVALASLGVLTVPTAIATGEPTEDPAATPVITVLTERPALPGQTTFTDNPAIVDPRPQSIEAWNRLPESNALAVQFSSGTPTCYGVDAEVQETADIIAVKLRMGTLPEAVNRPCIMLAVFGTLTVELNSPVGHRAVVSVT